MCQNKNSQKLFCYVCIQDLGQQGTLDEEAERKREEIESA